ncbi:nuclear transport factor 2 family protein [Flavobacterium sp.]|uniref:nuclear transport factor 2 family protein n=1 Tax=Flavobacterium sp. TaxID=239 RepID=UPI002631333E|nr:nuclear transport factor 2 family protein [Flavobacterium sp.]
MQKTVLLLATASLFASCMKPSEEAIKEEKQEINMMLDEWHQAAAEADYEDYFNDLTDDATYIGTDATENWNKKAFGEFAKPYFDKGQAWSFKPLQRNIYFNEDLSMAWFDELLDTQMKICRGSGVVIKKDGEWKIKHYVLSMTIPNDKINDVVKAKNDIENKLTSELKKQTP